jgi:hypothetical protein
VAVPNWNHDKTCSCGFCEPYRNKPADDHGVDQFRYAIMQSGRRWGKSSFTQEHLAELLRQAQARGDIKLSATGRHISITSVGDKFLDELRKYSAPKQVFASVDYGYLDPPMVLFGIPVYKETPTIPPYNDRSHINATEEAPKMDRLEVIESELRRLQKERAVLARFPRDTYANGTVIKFERVFDCSWDERTEDNVVWSYAAIKAGNFWHLTGNTQRTSKYTWQQLTEWLADAVGPMYLMGVVADILNSDTIEEKLTEHKTNSPYTAPEEAKTDGYVWHNDPFAKRDKPAARPPVSDDKPAEGTAYYGEPIGKPIKDDPQA